MWLERELQLAGKSCTVISADQITDEALVFGVGGMGAPTVGVEKLDARDEYLHPVRALEKLLGQSFSAVVCGEIGGSNALVPVICALQMGLPLVDGDGMGRAFPELQMDNFNIMGVSSSPLALGDSHGNVVILQKVDSAERAEQYGRAITIEMGSSAALVMPVMNGVQLRLSLIRGTYTLAHQLGSAILQARKQGQDAAEAAAAVGNGRVLFRGKIMDVERKTTGGFARGRLQIAGFGSDAGEMLIDFQNENLIAYQHDEAVCMVPDLITLLRLEDGEPIGTEMLRYGLRVAVIAMPAPRELKTEKALRVVGPRAFGYDLDFVPMAGNLIE